MYVKHLKNGKKVIIRPPRKNDAEKIRECINSLVDENAIITIDRKISLKEEKELLETQLEEIRKGIACVLVAECDGKIVGIANVRKGRRRLAHIGNFGICVIKEYRKKESGVC